MEKRLKKILAKIQANEASISRFLGVLVIVVAGSLLFNYFKSIETNSPSMEVLPTPTAAETQLVETEEGKLVPEGLPEEYAVQEGDSLWKIAEKFYHSGYNWVDIAKANNLAEPGLLAEGQKLVLPKAEVNPELITITEEKEMVAGVTAPENYTVKEGDSLWKIAVEIYDDGYQWVKIAEANNLEEPNLIHTGNVLVIPTKG